MTPSPPMLGKNRGPVRRVCVAVRPHEMSEATTPLTEPLSLSYLPPSFANIARILETKVTYLAAYRPSATHT